MQLTIDSHARVAFAIDVTGSMSTADCPDRLTRLQYACRCVQYLVETAPPELKRFDIMAFGTTLRCWQELERDEVPALLARLTASESQTYTAAVVRKAARTLTAERSGVLLIFTDGEPQDPAELTLALSSAPRLQAVALSVGRKQLDCALARAENTLLTWAARLEPEPPDQATRLQLPPALPDSRRLKHTPKRKP